MTPEAHWDRLRGRIDQLLLGALPPPDRQSAELFDAMRYAVLGGGKRVRPLLTYAACEAMGGPLAAADAPAVAVELVHAYSLIHDDLPAMDDDDLRRGRPSCHIRFGEATAILAGDALQALAFERLVADPDTPAAVQVAWTHSLARAAGGPGMVGGQACDLASEGKQLPRAELELLHARKTGALLRAAASMGALAGGAGGDELDAIDRFAAGLGLAFQIRDDLLDAEGDAKRMGKRVGADAALNKSTFPALLGIEGAKSALQATHERALQALLPLGERAERLRQLANLLLVRDH